MSLEYCKVFLGNGSNLIIRLGQPVEVTLIWWGADYDPANDAELSCEYGHLTALNPDCTISKDDGTGLELLRESRKHKVAQIIL
jgi:hypothetical protein